MEGPWQGFSERSFCWSAPNLVRGQWRYGEKAKGLIVEDEKNIVDILRFNLRKEGYDTLEAQAASQASRLPWRRVPT